MRLFAKPSLLSQAVPQAATFPLQELKRDEDGATAVEFSIIAMPFLMMLLGIISVCLYFFTVLELENAVWSASRDIRVGTYESDTYYAKPVRNPGETDAQYNERVRQAQQTALIGKICERMRDAPTCKTTLRVVLTSTQNISAASGSDRPNCKNPNGNGTIRPDSATTATGASDFVVLTACYAWAFGGKLPFFKIGNLPDGSFLVQATFAFVNENYN